jgi:hypothetical protein
VISVANLSHANLGRYVTRAGPFARPEEQILCDIFFYDNFYLLVCMRDLPEFYMANVFAENRPARLLCGKDKF